MAVHAVENNGDSDRIHLIFEYYDLDQPEPDWLASSDESTETERPAEAGRSACTRRERYCASSFGRGLHGGNLFDVVAVAHEEQHDADHARYSSGILFSLKLMQARRSAQRTEPAATPGPTAHRWSERR